jgi:hypothetical protein
MQQGIRVNSYIDDKQVSTRIDKWIKRHW